jgi:alpha-D-ribose 1-methylphosphonate 5-phosphate C-P lyase
MRVIAKISSIKEGGIRRYLSDNNRIGYNFAYLNESIKREIRRKILKAIAIPGHQVPYSSPEIPIARGWGTGGLQVTLAIVGPEDVLKVIDQGCDDSVNAVNLRRFISMTTGCETTTHTRKATLIQTRHRVPDTPLQEGQILVFQVPIPEPLREVEPKEELTCRMHAEGDYGLMWVKLYEEIVRWGRVTVGARYPVLVNGRYIMDPSPIPRWDVPKLNQSPALLLFGAGREKRIYAIPPHTEVDPLAFQDMPFCVENQSGKACRLCGSKESFLDEIPDEDAFASSWVCSDTDYCLERRSNSSSVRSPVLVKRKDLCKPD